MAKHRAKRDNRDIKSNQRKFDRFKAKASKAASKHNYQDAFADQEREDEFKGKAKYSAKPVKRFSSNDPQWYFKQDSLLKDVASFSYSKPLGTPIFANKDIRDARFQLTAANSVPGLMAITLVPTVGISLNAQSPLNLGAQNIYTRVRYKNSGAANYDAPDLMLYYIAMSSLYSAWNWAKRIYGYASLYSQVNWYRPSAYAKAENIDLKDIVANLSNYRAELNMLANEISAFCVPAVFNYMVRESWLYSNIYMDAETTKAQEYMFTPACFYRYDETSSPQGGMLVPISVSLFGETTMVTHTAIINMIRTMINALQYSSDIGNMSGDTLKEFGSDLFTLSHIDPDFAIEPVYNKEVLSQIENLTWTPHWQKSTEYANKKSDPWVIRQDPNTNFIKYQPTFTTIYRPSARDGIYLNFHWDNPTPEDVIVASRINVIMVGNTEPDPTKIILTSCGSEICIGVSVIYYATDADIEKKYTSAVDMKLYKLELGTMWLGSESIPPTWQSWVDGNKKAALMLYAWTAFDWAPALYSYIKTETQSTQPQIYTMLPDLRDWDVYTHVGEEALDALNMLALLSMFNVPN